MKLKFRRDQREIKGLLGGSKGFEFSLTFHAELTPEERELIKRYSDAPASSILDLMFVVRRFIAA